MVSTYPQLLCNDWDLSMLTKNDGKNSVIDKDWEEESLVPRVFYSWFSKMMKIFTCMILFAPDFFPMELQDDLQLNQLPFYFLHLFMALHLHAVPDWSDHMIRLCLNMHLSRYITFNMRKMSMVSNKADSGSIVIS